MSKKPPAKRENTPSRPVGDVSLADALHALDLAAVADEATMRAWIEEMTGFFRFRHL